MYMYVVQTFTFVFFSLYSYDAGNHSQDFNDGSTTHLNLNLNYSVNYLKS